MLNPKTVKTEGGIPLVGTVQVGGSRALALKLIYASILCGETCTLTNVPKSRYVLADLEIAEALGVKATWTSSNRLTINSQELISQVIALDNLDKESKVATAAFLVPALTHKFGRAILPKMARGKEYAQIWQSFGMEIKEDFDNYYIDAIKLQAGEVVLPYKSRVLTDMAILTAFFILGESIILNASLDIETDDLIDFCNQAGASIKRLENGSISVSGSGVFKGVEYTLPFDREEATFFMLATLLTNGNTTLKGIERTRLPSFLNWLAKVGANYEFSGEDMRIWHNTGTPFEKTEISVLPHPGFITDFAPMAVLFNCFAQGESVVYENLLATNLDYIKDLCRLGANIDTSKSEENIEIKVQGGVKLKSGKLAVTGLRYALVDLLFALCVEGKNELAGFEIVEGGFENMVEQLRTLGASVV
ncbi:hypothetical protein COT50_04075 [candidate division WWE3 bacterium CG08_land_8_20_14_0_20_41_10]|uniref:UDP-N-acetylglucosamine 1-carboxyvinyltransferase n=1 Tax=candidate division WWE3 bacterium CG08_land_8_20_14_0_20_41_10 TaxID=1975085 RepID=A0A2H0XAU0_UNCKA|nr:MAG: hypothetical protein COT50_04075 [candidate division WWE3 bacterium CG08_land_8_20_14_0_20_41_10]